MATTTHYPETKYKTRLSRSCTATDTTLYVDALPATSAGILIIDKDSDANYEIISYSGTAGAGTDVSPYTLTGVVRGLAASGYSLSAGTGRSHGRIEIGCADAHYFVALIKRHLDTTQTMPQSATAVALPVSGNTQYDLRYVQNEAKWYYWSLVSTTGAYTDWIAVSTGTAAVDATESVKGTAVIYDTAIYSQGTGGADLPIYGGVGANQSAAQSLTPTRTIVINQVVLSLKKTLVPTDNLTVALYSDSAGSPNALVATSGTLDSSTLTGSYVNYTFTFVSPQTLTGGTTYHFVIERSGARDTANFVNVQYNSATDRFPYGSLKKNDSAAWSANNYDVVFEIANSTATFMQGFDPRVNHPVHYGVDVGANDTYTIYVHPAPAGYYTGMMVVFKANTANTAAATIDVNGLGAKALVDRDGVALATGCIIAGQYIEAIYNGTSFVILNYTVPFTAKGDIVAASATTFTPTVLAVGTNGTVMMADSSTATGLKYAVNTKQLTEYRQMAESGSALPRTSATATYLGASLADTANEEATSVGCFFRPTGYNISTVKMDVYVPLIESGNFYLEFRGSFFTPGTSAATTTDTVAITTYAVVISGNEGIATITVPASAYTDWAAGMRGSFTVRRDASNAADTIEQNIQIIGTEVVYAIA